MKKQQQFQLTVAGQSLPVTHEIVPIGDVRLDPENPRIRLLVQRRFKGRKPKPDELVGLVKEQPAYDSLQKSIRKANGIHDPVIVSHDYTVIEGNCRTVVVQTLHAANKTSPQWKNIPVVRLPKDVDPTLFGLLTASHHIARKTAWNLFAQAGHIHHLHRTMQVPLEMIADEVRMTLKETKQYLEAYDFLIDEVLPQVPAGDDAKFLDRRFSHALEFMKGKKLESHRADPEKRAAVAKLLVNDAIKGKEVRDLPKIFENKKAAATLKKKDFKAATAVLRDEDPVSTSKILQKMDALTRMLTELPTQDMGIFREQQKAKDILVELHVAVVSLAEIAKVKLGGRRG